MNALEPPFCELAPGVLKRLPLGSVGFGGLPFPGVPALDGLASGIQRPVVLLNLVSDLPILGVETLDGLARRVRGFCFRADRRPGEDEARAQPDGDAGQATLC